MIAYLIINWNNIGENVPIHYNSAGQSDSWGSKSSLIVLPIVTIIVNISISGVLLCPQALNVPVKITEENYVKVYDLTRDLMNFTKIAINISFLYITLMSANRKPLGTWFLPIFFIIIFMPISIYYIKIRKV
ncbi:MAG: DUF1648 domain-containing protein [Paraclostridium bifermentans]|uniref:DUF1648 domain-containing protein n=1 Tax=Paraclostridium bifermentans TaxID=1490 RepID=UPI00241DE398|nr:DUF1648 domain-containing protein [Paraclostridium bifermentans]MBS5953885.1 DUF1648 domain-containing protein [Paraclostridium bifermentans]